MASQKAPQYIFEMGSVGLPEEFLKTGSGSHQKQILRELVAGMIEQKRSSTRIRARI